MHSRSNSTAGGKLRRAKSTSSTHAGSSGHQRQRTTIDSSHSHHQAAAAAAEAYERARLYDDSLTRPVPPKLQRRRSQATGKSEGSHFEDARRKSIAREGDAARSRPQRSHDRRSGLRTSQGDEERTVTRKRSAIPPLSDIRLSDAQQSSSLPSTGRLVQRRQSEYTDGSPAPRYSHAVAESEPTPHTSYLPPPSSDGYGGNLNHLSSYSPSRLPRQPDGSPRPPPREHQDDDDILNVTRDQCLQDFQTKRVRERKSFILGPFQRRRPTPAGSTFDNALPPFNYTDDGNAAPVLPNPAPALAGIKVEQRSRNFSDSLKGRLKKVFLRSSKAPAQHVEAKDFQFTVRDTDISDIDNTRVDSDDPFLTVAIEHPKQDWSTHSDSLAPRSVRKDSGGRSRVTSWTNSTVAGVSSIRTNTDPLPVAGNPAQLPRDDSMHTLRKASSFFGRPVQNKLRRVSKQNLRGSEESLGLYSALRKRIRPARSADPVVDHNAAQPCIENLAPVGCALGNLPSQQPNSVFAASIRTASTVRAITPQSYDEVNVPSPIREVMNPEPEVDADQTVIHTEQESPINTPCSNLKRRPAFKAPPPTQEQLIRRMELSKNRWKSPLDELSPPAPRSTRVAMMEDNPYELRSLSHTLRQTTPANDIPCHAKVADGAHVARTHALSPSVYSRATDGASPRPITPEELGMTTITVTGREVRRYGFSSPKGIEDTRRTHASREWRRWLSDEFHNLDHEGNEQPKAQNLALYRVHGPRTHNDSAVELPRTRPSGSNDQREVQSSSASAAVYNRPRDTKPAKSRRDSSTSTKSYMNERYPIIHGSRPSSRQSAAAATRQSSTGLRSESTASPETENASDYSKNSHHHKPATAPAGQLSPNFETDLRSSNLDTPASGTTVLNTSCSSRTIPQALPGPSMSVTKTLGSESTSRPRSAYELRVSYKNGRTDVAKQLEVRRKPLAVLDNSLLEDSTILNISAGPYASGVNGGGENARPPLDESILPAMSSSEWLAAGREVKKATSMYPLARHLSSPQQKSPGQRLVTNWLDERKSKENTPAFV